MLLSPPPITAIVGMCGRGGAGGGGGVTRATCCGSCGCDSAACAAASSRSGCTSEARAAGPPAFASAVVGCCAMAVDRSVACCAACTVRSRFARRWCSHPIDGACCRCCRWRSNAAARSWSPCVVEAVTGADVAGVVVVGVVVGRRRRRRTEILLREERNADRGTRTHRRRSRAAGSRRSRTATPIRSAPIWSAAPATPVDAQTAPASARLAGRGVGDVARRRAAGRSIGVFLPDHGRRGGRHLGLQRDRTASRNQRMTAQVIGQFVAQLCK